MDPLSIAASIGSLCGTAVKLISAISEFVDSVRDAPKEVQALSNQLASQYAALGQLKVAIGAPRASEIPKDWFTEFEKVLVDTSETLTAVGKIVDKSKKTDVTRGAGQIMKSIKFTFEAKQVRNLKARLHFQTSLLANLLAALHE
jgi:hypothetical protein